MIARESVGVGEWSRCSPFDFDSLTHSRIPIAIVIRPLTHSLRVLSASGSGGGALGTNGCNCITLGRWEHCMFGVASTARPTFSRIFPPHVVYYSEKGSKQSPEKKMAGLVASILPTHDPCAPCCCSFAFPLWTRGPCHSQSNCAMRCLLLQLLLQVEMVLLSPGPNQGPGF